MVFTPITAMAMTPVANENYIDIEVPLISTNDDSQVMRAMSPLVGNAGKLNAFFNAGQTSATTNMAILDFRNSSLPSTAKITKVEVVSQRTAVAGMTYYVQIGKGTTVNNFNWAPNISWASTVNTTYFNNTQLDWAGNIN